MARITGKDYCCFLQHDGKIVAITALSALQAGSEDRKRYLRADL